MLRRKDSRRISSSGQMVFTTPDEPAIAAASDAWFCHIGGVFMFTAILAVYCGSRGWCIKSKPLPKQNVQPKQSLPSFLLFLPEPNLSLLPQIYRTSRIHLCQFQFWVVYHYRTDPF